MFEAHHRVQFYETDLMRIVHHSNYIRYFEEARVAWAFAKGLIRGDQPETASAFAVLETHVRHIKPARFGDSLRIEVQAQLSGPRIVFEYKLWKDSELLAECRTSHVNLDEDLRPRRPSEALKAVMEKEAWNETWLSSL